MIRQTIGQQKTLKELQDYYDYARNSELLKQYRIRNDKSLKFYHGEQWDPLLLKQMDDVGAMPLTINRIEPIIGTYVSLQIANRKRNVFKSSSGILKHEEVADSVTNMFTMVQTHNDFQSKHTQKFTDGLIGGIGCTHFCYDPITRRFYYDYVDGRELMLDPDDQTLRFENSNFIIRSCFVSVVVLKQRYPEHAHFFDDLLGKEMPTDSWLNPNNSVYDDELNVWTKGRSIKIVEVYYKKNSKYYETTVDYGAEAVDEDGIRIEQFFNTFNKDFAEAKKEASAEIKTLEGTKIFKGVFCSDMLLESGPLYAQVPNQKHFPLLPLCLKRDYNGIPYGVVEGLIPLSISLNYIWTKTMHSLSTKHLIIDDPQMDIEKMRDILRVELNRRDGLIFSKNPQNVQLVNSESLLPYFFQGLQRVDVEFEQRTQLFDELKGDQTNATSGIGMQIRAQNSARSQTPLNALYDHMLLSEGQLMLDTLKGIDNFNYAFNYIKNGKINYSKLTSDISTINFEIFPDTAPNFTSTNEEKRAMFEGLLDSPSYAFVLSDPAFLKNLGFEHNQAAELHEAYLRALQTQQQPQQISTEDIKEQAA